MRPVVLELAQRQTAQWLQMRMATGALLLTLLSLHQGWATPEPAPPHPTVTMQGRGYVRVAAWAKTDKLDVRWVKRNEVLELRSRAATITLKANSREARVNGTAVWLTYPVLGGEGGAFYVSSADVAYTFGPLLNPPRKRRGMQVATVCLDAGHGGKDPGNRLGLAEEKTYTLLLAQELRRELETAGFKVIMTRSADEFIDLPSRPALAAKRRADLFISLHFNSAGANNKNARGVETYCLTLPGAPSTNGGGDSLPGALPGNRHDGFNLLLAYHIQKAMVAKTGADDRGVRRARFAVLRDASVPAVLVEGGFMTNPGEAKRIAEPGYRRTLARAITNAVLEFKRDLN